MSMKPSRMLLLVACAGIATPAAAANSAYDLLVVACDDTACRRIVEQTVSGGLAKVAEVNRAGLRLIIETLARRNNEEDTRVSLNVSADESGAWRPTATMLAQRLETLVVKCTFRHGAFSPLTSFVSSGTTYQVWGRLAAAR